MENKRKYWGVLTNWAVNPKARVNSSGALRLEGQRGKARSRSCGVPEGLKPRSSRWLTGQHRSSAAARGLLTCVRSGAAARGGGEGAASGAESGRGAGRAGRPGRRRPESEATRARIAGAETRLPARRQWLARRRSGALLKARSHSWGFFWPMGGGRAGGGGASLGSSLRPPLPGALLSS